MTTLTDSSIPSKLQTARPVGGVGYDWLIVALSVWLVGGVHLDAWAHHQFEVESFFTPWHGVLYSGFLAAAAVLAGTFVRNLSRGHAWRQAMPVGYELSLLGAALFMAGGVGDGVWHALFGIEVNIEALLSPTHLLLGLGGALIVTGPLRAAWARRGADGRTMLPALLSLALLLAVLTFFTAYANPIADAQLAQGSRPQTSRQVFSSQALGVAGILLQTGFMMGVVLLALRRWRPPFGSLALIFTASTSLTVSVHGDYHLVPLALLAGLSADLFNWRLQPSAEHPGALRLFAFAVPFDYYALYFGTLFLAGGVWWSVHLWAGAIVLAGIGGWLLSYAFVRPALPAAQADGASA